MIAPGMTGGLAAGMSKYRHAAPIRKLRTNPIKILVIAKFLSTNMQSRQRTDRGHEAANEKRYHNGISEHRSAGNRPGEHRQNGRGASPPPRVDAARKA